MTIAIAILLIIGIFFALIGVIGILRMPDVYGRLQASTCIATMSTICVCAAGVVYAATNGISAGTALKLVLLAVFILCTNPISNHALCKAAYHIGIKPAKEFAVDDLAADYGESAHIEDEADKPDNIFDEPEKEDPEDRTEEAKE